MLNARQWATSRVLALRISNTWTICHRLRAIYSQDLYDFDHDNYNGPSLNVDTRLESQPATSLHVGDSNIYSICHRFLYS